MVDGQPAAVLPSSGDTTSASLLSLRGIDKWYGREQVLRAIDLDLADGEFLTILGPSGSGKTTILRLIAGFIKPDSGSVVFEGSDIVDVPIFKRPFNTVFQDYALFPHMTVAGNVGYGLMVRGEHRSVIREQVDRALRTVALETFAERYPGQLSGGQRQRVALARALICRPRVILLDEPLAALDAELRRQMQHFLKHLQRQVATTFLFVTHDQEEAITMSDRIVVMNEGGIEQTGTPRDLYYSPATEFVAGFFGDNNLIAAEVTDEATGTARASDGLLHCAAGAPAGPCWVVVRPEAIRIGPAALGMANSLTATIEEMIFVGPTSDIIARTSSGLGLRIKMASENQPPPVSVGQQVELGWEAASCAMVTRR